MLTRGPRIVKTQRDGCNAANVDAQARLSFAIECMDGSHYLVDLDEHLVSSDAATDVLGHHWQVVDMAHVRWPTGTAISALDLCAAALGRLYCGISGDWDLSVKSARETLTAVPGRALAMDRSGPRRSPI